MDIIFERIKNAQVSDEFCRVFHGRGGSYPGLEFVTVDSIMPVLGVAFYFEPDAAFESEFVSRVKNAVADGPWECATLQRRYLPGAPGEIICGTLPENLCAIEDGLRYSLNLITNRNTGFFPDMVNGRAFIKEQAKGKKVLNLFSYTCSFSVVAIAGGASEVVNVDMSKGALTTGRTNHRINDISTDNVTFMPYNILKSWGRIKRKGPYDIIIIDPPTFQKGSFAADKDYAKILRKLPELASADCTILAALNSPDHDTSFLKNLFTENCPQFAYKERLANSPNFPSADEERSLKCLLFQHS